MANAKVAYVKAILAGKMAVAFDGQTCKNIKFGETVDEVCRWAQEEGYAVKVIKS